MKTKTNDSIAKGLSIFWIALIIIVIFTYTTSCSTNKYTEPDIIQVDGFVGSHEYYEIMEAISTVDDMKEWVGQDIENGVLPKEYGESYLMWLSSISSDLNDLLFERIVANN